jgi:AbrB family looped-hinge helix DNA binding protein
MQMRSARVKVSDSGRLSIPADMRRDMGIENGGTVSLLLDESGLHIESSEQFIRRVQKLARDTGLTAMTSVDDFLAWKREEARREDAEMFGK